MEAVVVLPIFVRGGSEENRGNLMNCLLFYEWVFRAGQTAWGARIIFRVS